MMARAGRVVGFSAGVEAVTAFALIAAPALVARLLLGEALAGAGIMVARCFGVALLALSVAVWPRRDGAAMAQSAWAMLLYNAILTLYLAWLGTAGHMGGPLLWPAAAVHGAVAALLVRPRG